MAGLDQERVIPQKTIDKTLEFSNNLAAALVNMNKIFEAAKKNSSVINDAVSPSKVNDEVVKLTASEKELIKVQNQVATAQAKLNDNYIAEKKKLEDVNKALKDKKDLGDKDSKTVKEHSASINQLGAALDKNRRAYKDLKTEEDRNSESGKKLKEIITEQRKAFIELSQGIGENKETVGAYREELEGLNVINEELEITSGRAIRTFKELGRAFIALATNPYFLAIAALVITFKALQEAVKTYFESTEEGERANERLTASYDAFFATAKKGFSDLGKSVYDFLGGETALYNLQIGILEIFSEKLAQSYARAAGKGISLANTQHELIEEQIKDIVKKAKAELDADVLVLASKDKLQYSDEQRLVFLKAALEIRTKQAEHEAELAKQGVSIALQQVAIEKDTTVEKVKQALVDEEIQKEVQLTADQKRKIAEAEAEVLNKQKDLYEQNRRVVSQIATEELAIYKAKEARARASQDAENNLAKEEINSNLKTNQAVIKSVKSSQQEITTAIYQEYINRQHLAEEDEKEQLLAATRASEDRVTAQGVYDKAEIAKRVASDKTLAKERLKIHEEFNAKSKELDNNLAVDLNTNIFTNLKKDFDNLTNDIKKGSNEDLKALNQAFLDGNVGIVEYETKKKEIIEASNRKVLIAQSDFAKKQIESLHLSKEAEKSLLEEYSKLENDILDKDAAKDLERKKKVHELELRLQDEAFNATKDIITSISETQAQAVEVRIKNLQDEYQRNVQNAGDNQALKDRLAEQEKEREDKLQHEKVRIQQRAARYEKAIAITQIAINTEEAASKAYAELGPYGFAAALLLAGIGAAEIAAVAAKPVPQYFTGGITDVAGPIIAGERGRELLETPSGQFLLTPNKATLYPDIEKGTRIYNTGDTTRMLAETAFSPGGIKGSNSDAVLTGEVVNQLKEVKKAISQQPRVNYKSMLSAVNETTEYNGRFRKTVRAMAMGKWVK